MHLRTIDSVFGDSERIVRTDVDSPIDGRRAVALVIERCLVVAPVANAIAGNISATLGVTATTDGAAAAAASRSPRSLGDMACANAAMISLNPTLLLCAEIVKDVSCRKKSQMLFSSNCNWIHGSLCQFVIWPHWRGSARGAEGTGSHNFARIIKSVT